MMKEQKMTSSMCGYGKDVTRIPGVVSMNVMSGVFGGNSLRSLYVWIYENNVKEIERFLFTLLLLSIVFLFAFHIVGTCKSYIARNV